MPRAICATNARVAASRRSPADPETILGADVPIRRTTAKGGETGSQAPVPPEFTGAVKRDGGLLQHEECRPKSHRAGVVERSKFTHLPKTERLLSYSRKP